MLFLKASPVNGYSEPVSARGDSVPSVNQIVPTLLAAHPVFSTLPEQDQRELLRWSKIRTVKRHEVICRQDDPASQVVFMLEGYARLSTPLDDGAEMFLGFISPGASVGEAAALQKVNHSVNVTTLTTCRMLLIDGRQFRQAFTRHLEGLLAILRLTEERIQGAVTQLMEDRSRNAAARLAKILTQLARLSALGSGRRASLPLRPSQGELGAMAGMSRELVNRHLGAWRDAGWIEMRNGVVTSVDIAALSDISGDEVEDNRETKQAFG